MSQRKDKKRIRMTIPHQIDTGYFRPEDDPELRIGIGRTTDTGRALSTNKNRGSEGLTH